MQPATTGALAVLEQPEPARVPRRIALLNNKGGVGKTMLTLAFAEAAARVGQRVLAVDMDPQGNLSRRLGRARQQGHTLAEVLAPGVTNGAAHDVIGRCGWDLDGAEQNIAVLPASLALEDRVLEAGIPGAALRLRKALYGADDGYDFTLIDCPPSMGHLTQLALAALDGDGQNGAAPDTVLIPIAPDWDAIAGARRVIQFITTYRADLQVPHLCAAGLLVNQVRPQTTLHSVRVTELTDQFPDVPVLRPAIPLRTRIAELQDAGEPLSTDGDLARAGLVADLALLASTALAMPNRPVHA